MFDHDQCTAINDFPAGSMEDDHEVENFTYYNSTILIPDMEFTCSGTVVRVRVTGHMVNESETGNQSMKLQIWRNTHGEYFKRIHKIALPTMCERNMPFNNMFHGIDCMLKQDMSVTVKFGDILGIELPPNDASNFELYSLTECRVTGYIFNHNLQHSIIDLHNGDKETTARPLIRIELNGTAIV